MSDLEGNAFAIRAADCGDAIKISCTIKKQAAGRTRRSIIAASESVNHTQSPCAIGPSPELVNGAETIGSAGRSHSVEISVAIKSEAASGTRTVIAPGK